MCARVDDTHGLELQSIHYRAPGDSLRSVLSSIHLAEALLHYHEDSNAIALISEQGLGGAAINTQSSATCTGNTVSLANASSALCSVVEPAGILAKYGNRQAIHADKWTLSLSSTVPTFNLSTSITFTEDGRIEPSSELSGRVSRFTDSADFGNRVDSTNRYASRATLLYTWRMDFALNTADANDRVEEFDYTISFGASEQRPMTITSLDVETFRDVERNRFRGWRILDPNGSGYYLDPQNNGYSYVSRDYNWAQFDLAITRSNDCERLALNNEATSGVACGESLDDYVNGESLNGARPTLWFSITRLFNPNRADFPAIQTLDATFELLPFDWTSTSPFEVIQ